MEFEWGIAKSERNRIERDLPFGLAIVMFDSPVVETIDGRRDYGEIRVKAIGVVGGVILHCVYTERAALGGAAADHQSPECQQEGAPCLSCDVPGR